MFKCTGLEVWVTLVVSQMRGGYWLLSALDRLRSNVGLARGTTLHQFGVERATPATTPSPRIRVVRKEFALFSTTGVWLVSASSAASVVSKGTKGPLLAPSQTRRRPTRVFPVKVSPLCVIVDLPVVLQVGEVGRHLFVAFTERALTSLFRVH